MSSPVKNAIESLIVEQSKSVLQQYNLSEKELAQAQENIKKRIKELETELENENSSPVGPTDPVKKEEVTKQAAKNITWIIMMFCKDQMDLFGKSMTVAGNQMQVQADIQAKIGDRLKGMEPTLQNEVKPGIMSWLVRIVTIFPVGAIIYHAVSGQSAWDVSKSPGEVMKDIARNMGETGPDQAKMLEISGRQQLEGMFGTTTNMNIGTNAKSIENATTHTNGMASAFNTTLGYSKEWNTVKASR